MHTAATTTTTTADILASTDGISLPADAPALNICTWQQSGRRPTASAIAEAVQWAMHRHRESLTGMPPDVSVSIDKSGFEVRSAAKSASGSASEAINGAIIRKKLLDIAIDGVSFQLTISPSTSGLSSAAKPRLDTPHKNSGNNVSKNRSPNSAQVANHTAAVASRRGFATLSGALIQLRLVVKRTSVAVQLACANLDTAVTTDTAVLTPSKDPISPAGLTSVQTSVGKCRFFLFASFFC